MNIYSTAAVAKAVGVHKVTLIRWLLDGKVREPQRVKNGGSARLWMDRDVERVKKYKAQFYRKGRGRKSKLR